MDFRSELPRQLNGSMLTPPLMISKCSSLVFRSQWLMARCSCHHWWCPSGGVALSEWKRSIVGWRLRAPSTSFRKARASAGVCSYNAFQGWHSVRGRPSPPPRNKKELLLLDGGKSAPWKWLSDWSLLLPVVVQHKQFAAYAPCIHALQIL